MMTKDHAVREGDEPPEKEDDSVPKEEQPSEQPSMKYAKIAVVSIAALIVGILIGQVALPGLGIGLIALPSEGGEGPVAGSETLDMAALQVKIESYLNENVLGPQGYEGKVIGINDYDADFYDVGVEIMQNGQSMAKQNIFLTKSGNALSGTVFFLDEPIPQPEPTPEPQPTPQPSELQKSERPVVELFIMSYCPYGLQAQKALLPAWDLLGEKADISIKFVDYIMHGWKEIEENNVQYCIQENEPEKYVEFAKCFAVTDDSVGCREQVGIDEAQLTNCIAAADQQFGITAAFEDEASWLSGRYPVYSVHAGLNDQYGVGGSPSLIINGVSIPFSNRSPEGVKQAICNAFIDAPEECDEVLSSDQASPGIGGGTGAATAAECS